MNDQKNKSKSEKTQLPNPHSNTAKPAMKNPVAITGVLLFIAAIAFCLYRVETLLIKNAELEKHLALITQNTQNQTQKSGQLTQAIEQSKNQMSSMSGQLAFMQQTLNQIPGARLADWKLAEVEYLLRLGNQRVNLQKETAGASALFDAANHILAELDDPALLIVREKIAEEMLLLGQANIVDTQGIYAQIQGIKTLVHDSIQPPNTFKQAKPVHTKPVHANTEQNSSLTSDMQASPDISTTSLLQQFLSLVSVRTREKAFDAPLTTAQYQLLEHSLNLMLEQAQWALLRSDQALFEASLNNAQNWIETTLRHQQAEFMLDAIQQLKELNIRIILPDVSQSLRLLRQIVKDRTYAPTNVNTTPESKNVPEDSHHTPTAKESPVKQEQV